MSLSHSGSRARTRNVSYVVAALAVLLSAVGLAPVAGAADPVLSFVGSSSSVGNRTNHTVTVPTGVQAGDTLVLFMTTNSVSGTLGSPAGWSLLESEDSSTRGRAWTKQATAGDAGSTVSVAGTTTIKDTMTVAAYRSAGGTPSVTASASTAGASGTSFTTPSVAVAQAGSWLVSSWSHKSSTAATWTAPGTVTTRETPTGTGSGKISSLLADSGAPVATGTAPGRTATTDTSGGGAQLFSVVVSPGTETGTPPTNRAPVASFTVDCTNLTCDVDATDSTDPDNDPLTYAWNFGDGTTGTGVTSSRTYTSAGARTITLTVGDGTTTTATTRTANPTTTGGGTAALSYVGAGSAAGNRRTHTVRIPTTVAAGDRLVLFMSTNSIGGTLGSPTGWTLLQSRDSTATRGRVWTRQATTSDANSLVTVTSSTTIKDVMSVAAYRSTSGTATISASTSGTQTASATSFTTPSVPVAQSGSWLLSYWSEKSSTTKTWTRPTGTAPRATPAATGSGKVSSLLVDSTAPVPTGTAAGRTATLNSAGGGAQLASVVVTPGTGTPPPPPPPPGTSPPGHTELVPQTPRTDLPKISNGEIWDIEILGNRVFIAGSFTSIQNQRSNNTTTYTRSGIASYNLTTGLVDTAFNPQVTGGGVDAVEATPDGTKLYIAGSYNAINGTTKRGVARVDLTTGAPVSSFTTSLNARASELAVTNTTVYIGGRFTAVNNIPRVSLVAVDATTGAVDSGFVNNLSGGLGVGGALTVQRLVLTYDESKLLVVHTGRQVAGEDRYGVALINTVSKQLLPWRTRLWEDNLQYVGGIQRAYGAAISPDDSWFVVTSGSGGDRPPINDTAIAFPIAGGDNVEARWITRCFDSIYSVAISETAVYIGGHMAWAESPTAPDPWPGLDDVGYGTGQGLSGYALGDAVVNREHLAALSHTDGKALEWNPGSNSYEGNKHIELTPRGLFTGGDATTQGGANIGRIAFYDFDSVPASNGVETAITAPIEGRVNPVSEEWTVRGTASVPSGSVSRVELEVRDRGNGRYLADNLTSWQSAYNTINATLQSTGARTADWSVPLTLTGNVKMQLRARTVSSAGTSDNTWATKKTETFGLTDQPPNTSVTGPSATLQPTMTFTVTGSATDDVGVSSVSMTVRRTDNGRYLQADGSESSTRYSFRITPDVVGAKSTTWSREITIPSEGEWRAQARAVDSAGQSDLDTGDRTWIVSEDGVAPSVSISAPATMVPPTAAQPLVITPGSRPIFRGSANDDGRLASVEVTLRNSTTRENLAADGSFNANNVQAWHRVSPVNLDASSHNWTWTPTFDFGPGNYTFQVRAVDNLGLATSTANRGVLVLNAQVPGDAPPNGLLDVTGTVTGGQSLHLDLTGTATDDQGVAGVRVSLYDADTAKYLQPGGGSATTYATLNATLASPGATSTTWTLPVDLPQGGDWNVTAFAVDSVGQLDTSTSGATARYRIYPGDNPPTLTEGLLSPTEGTTFSDGRLFVSGRAEDDQAMQRVEIAVVDSAGRYLNSSGTFTSTTASWRTAFLTSPGTPGSNFSYTSPVVPPGAYTITVRGMDNHDQYTAVPSVRNVTVEHPPGNTAPVASFTVSCAENVCTYDGRGSTDENAPTLTYAWNYGNGTGSGPLPTRTYTAAAPYTVTLTVTDEWGVASAPVSQTVTIVEPAGNVAPTPANNPPACSGLVCNFSAVGSTDPNTGDSIRYLWEFGDGTTSTSTSPSKTYTAPNTYTVRLTATDGWGKSATREQQVTVTSP